MKKVTWLLFLGYFLIFVIIGIVFYYKYLNRFISSGAEPAEVEIITAPRIYYSEATNLWALNPDIASKIGERSTRIQSTGSTDYLDFNSINSLFAYAAINKNGTNDIWQFQLKNNQSQKITDSSYEILNDYVNFFRPKYSPTGGSLAFIGRGGSRDSILVKDLITGNIADVTPTSASHILDFSWNQDGEKIIYCTSNLEKNYCEIKPITAPQATQKIEIEVRQISWEKTLEIIYLSQGNLFRFKEGSFTPATITTITSPKQVVSFDIDEKGKHLVFQINDGDSSDIYLSEIDGTNITELTSSKNSRQPLLSPEGDRVAFFRQNDGVYVIDANKTAEAKILNINNLDHLLIWR